MKNKKHVKYFLVANDGGSMYIKLESDLIFSDKEGEDSLRQQYPKATSINKIAANKAKIFLELDKLNSEQNPERSVATAA